MEVETLKLVGYRKEDFPKQHFIPCNLKDEFIDHTRKPLPAVFLIKGEMFERLKKFRGTFIEKEKDPRKGLAFYCIGCEKIPHIKAHYEDVGQAIRSFRRLYERAHLTNDRNIYFVEVEENIFQDILDRGQVQKKDKKSDARKKDKTEMENHKPYREWAAEELYRLMDKRIVPDELKKEYIGSSMEIQLIHQEILHAGQNDHPVLILGETGTGKEKIARAIHHQGQNKGKRFVSVNCATIPDTLFESELFGHEKGAFTGATKLKIGLWETAKDGTLFLDEIGDLPQINQVKILRAIEYHKFKRVGGTDEIEASTRVIAATNQDLFAMMKTGSFREELYYRLRNIVINAPPLRHHLEDIPELAQSVWAEITNNPKATLHPDVVQVFQRYRWPGNVREMRSVLIRLYGVFHQKSINLNHLKAIYQMDASIFRDPDFKDKVLEINWKGVDSLELLRRAERVLDSIGNGVKSLLLRQKIRAEPSIEISDPLYHQIIELVSLLIQSIYFQNHTTLVEIKQLGNSLQDFVEKLRRDKKEALNFWEDKVYKQFSRVHQLIMEDIGEIMAKY